MTLTLVMTFVALLAQPPAAPPAPPVGQPPVQPPAGAPPLQPILPAVPEALATQVMLDRAGFSPGAIDGRSGANTKRALAAFEGARKPPAPPAEAITRYRITPADAAGPYAPVVGDLMEQSKMPALGYASIVEMLGERFHATPALLQQLNPGATFRDGDEIVVPNVQPMVLPAPPPKIEEKKPKEQVDAEAAAARERMAAKPAVTVTVAKTSSDLRVTDASGAVLMYAPVTTGSEKDPLPIGEWKVTGVLLNPTFNYNPDLFWDADPTHSKAKIAAGPNNPVGLVWVDLSKEHYGVHGTPQPETIGRSESHGCVRLTNWDALRLAGLVKPGTRVVFKQ